MFKNQKPEILSLCALLSIWICVIISHGFSPDLSDIKTAFAQSRPVLILDAGHGGMDGGAISATGKLESEINWQIAERVRDMALFLGIPVMETRPEKNIEYPAGYTSVAAGKRWDTRRRVQLVNQTENAVLISIHQNSYPDKSPRGVQVLFRSDDVSCALAQSLQSALGDITGSDSRPPVKAAKDIYLMSHVTNPAVLIECGFISNPGEAVLLESNSHQKKLSLIIAAAYYNFTGDEIF